MYVTNYLWQDKTSDFLIKKKLTYIKINYDSSEEEFVFYKEINNEIGIPRYFDSTKLQIAQNKLTNAYIEWPKVEFNNASYREGQEESINKCTNYLQNNYGGRLEAPTGSGKTKLAGVIASNLNQKTLVLVHKFDLVEQWEKLSDANEPLHFPNLQIGRYHKNKIDYKDKHLIITTFQTLYSRIDKLEGFFKNFGLIVVDEGHVISARTFTEVLSKFTGKIFAVSATFRRKDRMDFVWDWFVGPLIHKHQTEKVVGKYYLKSLDTDLNITGYHQIDLNIITKNYKRNKIILNDIKAAAKKNRKILVLTDRTKHCEWLQQELGDISETYIGKKTKEQRQQSKEKQVIIATYQIFCEGVDVPTLDTLFILTPKTDIEQALGRIQRVAEKKEPVFVYYVDNNSKFLKMAKRIENQLNRLGFTNGYADRVSE